MSDDLISFKMLVASEVVSERDLLRECAAKAAFPVDCVEVANLIDPVTIRDSVARDSLDFIFVDSCIAMADRREIYDAARSTQGRPLVIFVGPAELMQREAVQDNATADGMLTRPFGMAQACAMIDNCARARLPKQVLVADNSATVRAVIRKVLQASRFHLEVTDVEDGKAAVELANRQQFDLALLDCKMPEFDGFATLDVLRNAHNNLPVVMITSTRDSRLEDRARASGANDFLFKPFYANDIDTILRRLFGLVAAKAS